MSRAAKASKWVRRELHYAESKGVEIVPLLLEGDPLIEVIDLEYEDVTNGEMPRKTIGAVQELLRVGEYGHTLPEEAETWLTLAMKNESSNHEAARIAYKHAIDLEPQSARLHHEYARFLLRTGDTGAAHSLLDSAHRLSPRSPNILVDRSRAKTTLGQIDAALLDLDEAIILDPANSIGYTNRSRLLEMLGRHQESLADAQRATALDPLSAGAYLNLSVALYRLGRLSESLAAAKEAARLAPEDADVLSNLSLLLHEGGETQAALGSIERALSIDPDHKAAASNHVLVLDALNADREAVRAALRVLELDPRSETAYDDAARALNKLGKYDDALVWADLSLTTRPTARSHLERGIALRGLGDQRSALDSLLTASSMGLRDPYTLELLGRTYESSGDLMQAENSYRACLSLDSRRESVRSALSRVLADQGRHEEAAQLLADPDFLPLRLSESFLSRGRALQLTGKVSEAVDDYVSALEAEPNHCHAYANLSLGLSSLGQPARALEAAERAIEIDPHCMHGHINRAHACRGLNRWEQVAKSATMATQISDDSYEAWMLLGQAQLNQRRFRRAADAYGRAASCRPLSAEAQASSGFAAVMGGRSTIRTLLRSREIADTIRPVVLSGIYRLFVAHFRWREARVVLAEIARAEGHPLLAMELYVWRLTGWAPDLVRQSRVDTPVRAEPATVAMVD